MPPLCIALYANGYTINAYDNNLIILKTILEHVCGGIQL